MTCSSNEAEILLGTRTSRAYPSSDRPPSESTYSTAAPNGKRVQALTEAKNHALVLRDAALERTARGIVNSACGCAGERCMALPVVVAEEAIADKLVALITEKMKSWTSVRLTRRQARWGPRKRRAQEVGRRLDREGDRGGSEAGRGW